VVELEKKDGIFLLFSSKMGTAKQQKTEKKSVDLGFSKVGLLSFSLNFFEQSSKICTLFDRIPTQSSSSWMWSFYSL
jgi:hypothetical protein